MPRRIFPSLRRRRIRIDTNEIRLRTSELTDSLGSNIITAEPEEQYVELLSVILSAFIIRNCQTYVNSFVGKIFKKVRSVTRPRRPVTFGLKMRFVS
jgi:hypothetical protein